MAANAIMEPHLNLENTDIIESLAVSSFDHWLGQACHSSETEIYLASYKEDPQDLSKKQFVKEKGETITTARNLRARLADVRLDPNHPIMILASGSVENTAQMNEVVISSARMRISRASLNVLFEMLNLSTLFAKTLRRDSGLQKSLRSSVTGQAPTDADPTRPGKALQTIDNFYYLNQWSTSNVTGDKSKLDPTYVYVKQDAVTKRPVLLMLLNLQDPIFLKLRTLEHAHTPCVLTSAHIAFLNIHIENWFSNVRMIDVMSILVGPVWLNESIDDIHADQTHHMRSARRFIEETIIRQGELDELEEIFEHLHSDLFGTLGGLHDIEIFRCFTLHNWKQDIKKLKSSLNAFKLRLEHVQTMVFHATSLRAAKMANATNESMATLGRYARDDGEEIRSLTRLARDDAKIMKFIAVLTMVYLPATSVAQILSMGILDMDRPKSRFIPQLSSMRYIWFYLVVAGAFSVVTLGLGWYYSRRLEQERVKSQGAEEELKLSEEQKQKIALNQFLAAEAAERDNREAEYQEWRERNPVAPTGRVIGESHSDHGAAGGADGEAANGSPAESEIDPEEEIEREKTQKERESLNEFLRVMGAIIQDGRGRSPRPD